MQKSRGFTVIELIVIVAAIGLIALFVVAALTDVRSGARDKRRISDLGQVRNALELYYLDHTAYPRESEGADGNIAANAVFRAMLAPYLSGELTDPAGPGDGTFFYYYDGAHTCGESVYAVLFARQMDKSENANYDAFRTVTCSGVLDGEGRGGGAESYNIIIGVSGG